MGQVSAKLRRTTDGYAFWCAGCGETHHIRAGRMQFLGDCTHALAGQTIDLPDLPAWLRDAAGA